MCKKYSTYAIEVVHMNDNKHVKVAKDITSYNNTMALYRKVKEDYMNENVTINFIGIEENGDQGNIFTKRNTTVVEEKRNIEDLILCITEASQQLQEQFNQVNDKVSYYDKKKSNIEHLMIEGADAENLTKEDKVRVFNDLRKISLLRRDYKILLSLRMKTEKQVEQLVGLSANIGNKYEETINFNCNISEQIINKSKNATANHLIKKIPYKDHKERIAIMSMIEKNYDKVVNLEDEKVLACYNNCGKKKQHRQI